MSAVCDFDDAFVIELGPHIPVPLGCNRKRAVDIKKSDRLRGFLQLRNPFRDPVSAFAELFIFQITELILCVQNCVLELFEPLCCVALCSDQCLLSVPVRGHLILEGVCHLEKVAEDVVVFYAQCFDTGLLSGFLFKRSKPLFSLRFSFPEVIDILVVSGFDDTAVFHCKRRVIDDCCVEQPDQIRIISQRAADRCQFAFPER